MNQAPPHQERSLNALLELVRAARTADGNRCPRCGDTRIIAWGSFSGRQRHRCKGCRRTFSDFTLTPVAYSKRAHLWRACGRCMVASWTVRRAARRIGVHPTTAFRWRHRILAAVRRGTCQLLGGRVATIELVTAYSEKGTKRRGRAHVARRARGSDARERVIAVFMRDEQQRTSAEVVGRRFLTAEMLRKALLTRVAGDSTIITRAGAFSPYAGMCNRVGMPLLSLAPGTSADPVALRCHDAVATMRHRYRTWEHPFHGVATRYLKHYLAWFRFRDGAAGGARFRRLLERMFAGAVAVPRQASGGMRPSVELLCD
jgi:transposase-like protein